MPANNTAPCITSATFGLCVIASGLWRFLSAEGGHAGLWFGLVMGSASLLSSWLFLKDRVVPARVLIWTSLVIVGGWFSYESFIKKGLANAELRQLIIIGVTLVTALCILFTSRWQPGAKRQPTSTSKL